MPKATKRERQRQNRDMRREAMLAAEKRRKRFRTARTIGLLLIPIVIIFVIIQVTSGDDGSDSVELLLGVGDHMLEPEAGDAR